MYYYKLKNVSANSDYEDYEDYGLDLAESRFYAKKDDYLVYMGFNNVPYTGKVVGFISELDALTMDCSFNEVLSTVDVKGYLERKKAEVQEARLIKMMKAQADKDKLIEDMRKKANGSPQMKALFAEYEKLVGGVKDTPKEEDEEQTSML